MFSHYRICSLAYSLSCCIFLQNVHAYACVSSAISLQNMYACSCSWSTCSTPLMMWHVHMMMWHRVCVQDADVTIWWCDIFIWWCDIGTRVRARFHHRTEGMCTAYIWWCDIFIWWCDISIRVTAHLLSQGRGYVYSIHMLHQPMNIHIIKGTVSDVMAKRVRCLVSKV